MVFWANFILWDFHCGLKPVISKEIKRKKMELFRFKEMFSPIITCSNSRCSSSDFYFRWVQPQCSCGEVTLSLSLLTSWCGWGDAAPFPRCTSTLALPKVFQGPPITYWVNTFQLGIQSFRRISLDSLAWNFYSYPNCLFFSPKDVWRTRIHTANLVAFIPVLATSPTHTLLSLDYFLSSLVVYPSKFYTGFRFVSTPRLPGRLRSSSQLQMSTYSGP